MKRCMAALLCLCFAVLLISVPAAADSYLLLPGGEAVEVDDEGPKEPDYWEGICQKLRDAEEGDTVPAASRGHERVPSAVLRALEGRDITLKISAGKLGVVVLNGGALQPVEKNRIFYPIETLAELYPAQEF